jgi:hypothetical protein
MKSGVNKVVGRPTLIDLAKKSGIFSLSPSDLVFEANSTGIAYYDLVLSFSRRPDGFEIYLAKLDMRTNLEWFQTIIIPMSQLNDNNLPTDELSIITLGILTFRNQLANSRLLCLVNNLAGPDNAMALEALKRACSKFKCTHHVMATAQRRMNTIGSGVVPENKSKESMKMRILLCQSQTEINGLSSQTIREARYLLTPHGNPLMVCCFAFH